MLAGGGKTTEEVLTTSPFSQLMKEIIRERKRRNFANADALIRASILNRNVPNEVKAWALGQMLAVGQRMRNGNLVSFFNSVLSEPALARRAKAFLPASFLHEGSSSQAIAAYDANIQQYPNTNLARFGLYGKFALQLNNRRDTTSARAMLNQLRASYPQSLQAEMAELQMSSFHGSASSNRLGGGMEKSISSTLSVTPLPTEFALHLNYPNPFNPSTTINYDLPEASNVSLVVYDVLGRKVIDLVSGSKEAGYHSAIWNASSIASGVYFARFTATDANGQVKLSKVNKLLLAK